MRKTNFSFYRKENHLTFIHWGYFILLTIVYVPLIIYGGFGTSDDLALLFTESLSWEENLMTSLMRSGHVSRPIYSLVQVTSLYIFGNNPIYYTLFRLLQWLFILIVAVNVFRDLLGKQKLYLFIFLFSFPIFTSAHFFNAFQTGYLLSLLFWLGSLYFIKGTYTNSGPTNNSASTICLLLSLLSCEIMFPLFILNIGLPTIFNLQKKQYLLAVMAVQKKPILSISFLCMAYLVFKVFITPLYQSEEEIYGIGFNSNSFLQAIYYPISLVYEIPILLLTVSKFLFKTPWVICFLLIFPLVFFIASHKQKSKKDNSFLNLWLLFFALLCCSVIFLLSGYPAVTYGSYNKMLLPTFVVFCLLLANGLGYLLQQGYWYIVGLIGFLWISSMFIQVQNFNESWRIRKEILTDNAKKINEINLGENAVVLSNVPFFLTDNYNNDHVFWLSWDFSDGLKYFGLEKEVTTIPFCWQTLFDTDYFSLHNVNTLIKDQTVDNLWVYEYNLAQKQSTIKKITTLEAYKAEQITRKLNYHPIIPRARIRQFLKKTLKSKS